MFSSRDTLILGGTFTQIVNVDNRVKGGFERLQDAIASGAFHNSGERFDPPKCHANTRLAVLKRLMDWILRQDSDTCQAFIMWLYGPAGAGKSAIAQTLAEMCHSENKLLASFFFSRNDPLRGTAQRLVATLAYQLALKLPQQVREDITMSIDHDPLIFTLSLEAQLKVLIAQPISHLAESGFFDDPHAPRLMIIDGLDECENPEVQSSILHSIFQAFQRQRLPLLFLIASRPETDISVSFESPSATSILARLALDDSYLPDDDIKLFLREKFEEIKRTHKLKNHIDPSWPKEDVVKSLVHKSSGQFIYASTVVKFVRSARHRPNDRLDIILGLRPASGEAPFAELDALYTHIFSVVEDIARVQRIIGLLILHPDQYTDDNYEEFLYLQPGDLSVLLIDLSSVISLDKHPFLNYLVPRNLHASIKDFFLDESRSKDLYINPAERHTEYALLCFKHFNDRSIHQAIFHRLFYHSSLAITAKLRENIFQLSLETLVTVVRSWKGAISEWIPNFFLFLESLTSNDGRSLYEAQLESLDQFFKSHLEIYVSNPFLLFLLAASKNTAYSHPIAGWHYLISPFPRAFRRLDYAALDISSLFAPSTSFDSELLHIKYRQILIAFLENPARSGKYFIDGAKHANAAVCALTYTCNHWSQPLPIVHSDLDKYIRRNKPQRWRQKWGRNSVLSVVTKKHKPRTGTHRYFYMHRFPYGHYIHDDQKIHFNVRKHSWKKDFGARRVFRFALLYLPFLLKQAAKSKELFDFARRAKFGRRANSYPRLARLAKVAIEGYLARFVDGA